MVGDRLRTDTPGPITISATADSELGVLEVDRNDNSAALGLLAITVHYCSGCCNDEHVCAADVA
jgi:hypothetical protein